MKIIEIVATRHQILRLKCTKFDLIIIIIIVEFVKRHTRSYRGAFRPRPGWGSLQRSPDPPPAGFKGLLLREGEKREGRGGRSGNGREREKEEGEKTEEEMDRGVPANKNFGWLPISLLAVTVRS